MQQKDITLFVVIGITSAVFSIVLSNFLITPQQEKKQKAEVVEKISEIFTPPESNSKYFNKESVNPTKVIQIGEDKKDTLFKDAN